MGWTNPKILKNSKNSKNSETPKVSKAGGNFARGKGQRGEREVAKLFVAAMEEVEAGILAQYGPTVYAYEHRASLEVKRNTLQSDRGGFDLAGVPLLAPEIKFHETLTLGPWWEQCLAQCRPGLFPILIYRQSRQPWRVRSYLSLQNPKIVEAMHWVVADYKLEDFLVWFQAAYREHLFSEGNKAFQEKRLP